MPRIPQLPIQRDPHISGFQLAMRTPKDIGVPKAAGTRVVESGKGMLASGLKDVGKALGDVADYFALKAETTRVAKSQELQMGIAKSFREIWKEEGKLVGSQTDGQLERFQEGKDELRERLIPDGLSTKTTQELTKYFDRQFTAQAGKIVNHGIRQSVVADNEVRMLTMQNARENVSNLVVGDLTNLETHIEEVLISEQERHPNLTDTQIETNRRSVRQDLVNFALTKWMIDNPTAAVEFWNTNSKYIKDAIPKTYNVISNKMEAAKKRSNYNIAFGTAMRATNGDPSAAAKLIFDRPDEFGLDAEQALRLSTSLYSAHRHQQAQEEIERQAKEDEYIMSSHEKFYDPKKGTTNVPGAIASTEEAFTRGIIDEDIYNDRMQRLTRGDIFSTEDSHNLMSLIDDRVINTKAGILRHITGTQAKPEPFYRALDARDKQVAKGFTSNYFKEAYNKFTELSKIKKPFELPAKIAKKELLFDLADLPAFKRRLEAEARRLGYSAGDDRILDLADTLMEAGWFTSARPEFTPGKAPFFPLFPEYLRRWEYDPAKLYKEEKIEFMPSKTDGGGPEIQELIDSPKGKETMEAIKRLQFEKLPVNIDTINQAMEIIKREKEKAEE